MTTANHVVTGALIAVTVHNPVLAISVCYISHFVLDAIPHFSPSMPRDIFERNKNKTFRRVLTLNIISAAMLTSLIYVKLQDSVSLGLFLACIIAANLPDLVWIPRFIQEHITHKERPRGPISELHVRIQHDSVKLGAMNEIIYFAAALLILAIVA